MFHKNSKVSILTCQCALKRMHLQVTVYGPDEDFYVLCFEGAKSTSRVRYFISSLDGHSSHCQVLISQARKSSIPQTEHTALHTKDCYYRLPHGCNETTHGSVKSLTVIESRKIWSLHPRVLTCRMRISVESDLWTKSTRTSHLDKEWRYL